MEGFAAALTDHPIANLVFTLLFVPLFQLAKDSQQPWLRWLNDQSATWWSFGSAFVAALGIHISVAHAGDAHTATIAWTTSGLIAGATEWGKQFVSNHVGHVGYSTLVSFKKVLAQLEDPKLLGALISAANKAKGES